MIEPNPEKGFRIVLWMLVGLVIPVYLALNSIKMPGELVFPHDPKSLKSICGSHELNSKTPIFNFEDCEAYFPSKSTPHGYTWSLSLFIIPSLMIWTWLHFSFKGLRRRVVRKSFWLTIGILFPIGCLLDSIFGNLFFCFVNPGATLGIKLPGYVFGKGFKNSIPIEEAGFYLSGFITILSIYMWCDERWFSAYNIFHYKKEKDIKEQVDKIKGIFRSIHFLSIIIGVVLVLAAVLYKKFGPHEYHPGFPGYFAFLVAVSVIPSFVFIRTAIHFINWRAFSAIFFYILLISMMWEATLASPYGWWRYHYHQMMGRLIYAWSGLPIEAALLWMSVTFTTTIVYTTIKIWLISGKSFKKFFWG